MQVIVIIVFVVDDAVNEGVPAPRAEASGAVAELF
jgi:hypothetical protein